MDCEDQLRAEQDLVVVSEAVEEVTKNGRLLCGPGSNNTVTAEVRNET